MRLAGVEEGGSQDRGTVHNRAAGSLFLGQWPSLGLFCSGCFSEPAPSSLGSIAVDLVGFGPKLPAGRGFDSLPPLRGMIARLSSGFCFSLDYKVER
jgi:hypothetical protein